MTGWLIWSYSLVHNLIPIIRYYQIGIIVFLSMIYYEDYSKQAFVDDGQYFDFIIVGGGSAGCIVANRLTEVTNWTVLLIEAGDDPPYATEVPGLSVILGNNFPDWSYQSIDDNYSSQAVKNKKIKAIQGKMLGGSSTVNYMYYVRPYKDNLEDWVAQGNKGWDWNAVEKYYKRAEYKKCAHSRNCESENGFIGFERSDWKLETKKYLDAFKENGHNIFEDKEYSQMGYAEPTFNYYNKKRQSSSYVYIKPFKSRKNLFILKKTQARKVILEKDIAIGVQIKDRNGKIKNIYGRKEVIISAGSLNSPKLLMLSGIGPKEHLKEMGIDVNVDIENVGSNLQDHMLVPLVIAEGNGTSNLKDNFNFLSHLDKFPSPAIIGHVALDSRQRHPDYQVTAFPLPSASVFPTLMCSEVFNWNDEVCVAVANSTKHEVLFTLLTFLGPKSRGKISLVSKNPEDPPRIVTGYMSDKSDQVKFAKCVQDFTSVVNTTFYRNVDGAVVDFKVAQCKDIEFNTQEYWECYVLNLATTQFHFSGTCAMGPEGKGVVDDQLKVRGVNKLRVVDASIMPTIVSGNTFATVVLIAEKASEMIKSDYLK